MKVYISGPISGRRDYRERFREAEGRLRNMGFQVINPANMNSVLIENETEYEDYIKISLELMGLCDCICMIGDWWNSRGAKIEHEYAKIRGMDFVELEGITEENPDEKHKKKLMYEFLKQNDYLKIGIQYKKEAGGSWRIQVYNTTYSMEPIDENNISDIEAERFVGTFEELIMIPIINRHEEDMEKLRKELDEKRVREGWR